MSEQTPDTHNGVSDGQDPSMEDILASIRKIIAEDDMPSAEKSAAAMTTELESTGDVAALVDTDILDLNIVEDVSALAPEMNEPNFTTDVDALIGDMDPQGRTDLEIPDLDVSAPVNEALDYQGGSDDVLDLLIPDEENDSPSETALELVSSETVVGADDEIDALLGDLVDPDKASSDMLEIEPPEDDLSMLLDNMLEDSSSFTELEAPVAQETVIDPAADLLGEDDLLAALDLSDSDESSDIIAGSELDVSGADPDMMLVKSLMADLTEEPLHDADATFDSEAVKAVETAPSVELDIEELEDSDTSDMMDEILSVTLDDEAQLSEEALIPEIEAAYIEQDVDVPNATEAKPALSLKEIAAQAEADAQSADAGLIAAVAGIGAVSTAAILSDDAEDEISEEDSFKEELSAEELSEEELNEDASDDVETALSDFNELLDADTELPEDLTPDHPDSTTTESTIEETPPMPRAKKSDAIIDEVTESATAGAFASLTSVVEEKATVAERGDRIGDLVMEALQPMLKEWLDANLKGIVERAVTKEVKRISSGK